MDIILNYIIVAFILAMIYWWAIQGLFSAFLHLMVVIVAGALAFALWEPLVYGFGMHMQPMFAWGLWLLGPFVLLLIGLRMITDRVVRKNVIFPNLLSNILGGVCGGLSAILTAGVTVIGLGFLPLSFSLVGYAPLAVDNHGRIQETGSELWVPVNYAASHFFSALSAGSLSTSTPMAEYQPRLAWQAILFRMRYDPNASVVARPGSVEINSAYSHPIPVPGLDSGVATNLGQDYRRSGQKLVVVDTTWHSMAGTYDQDAALRLPPTQIRLVAEQQTDGGDTVMVLHPPVGFSHDEGDDRDFQAIDAVDTTAFGNRQEETFSWTFIVPADQTPRFLLARHTRLPLPELENDPAGLATVLGKPVPEPGEDGEAGGGGATGPSRVGGREGIRAGNIAQDIELTNALPGGGISTNAVPSLDTRDNGVVEGQAIAEDTARSLTQRTRIDSIWIPSHQRGVRLKIAQDRAQSLLGGARVAAASLQGVWLTDARGALYQPIGYVWLKASGAQQISVSRTAPIRSARQLPINDMRPGDELYLYFAVPKGASIVSYNIGDTTTQQIKPPLRISR